MTPRRGDPGYRTSKRRRSYESRAGRDGFALNSRGLRLSAKVLLVAIVLVDLFFLQLPGGHYLPGMPILLLLLVGPRLFLENAILGAVSLSFWGALGVFVFTRRRGHEAAASGVLVLLLGLIAWYFFSEVKPEPLGVLFLCSLGFACFPFWPPPGGTSE